MPPQSGAIKWMDGIVRFDGIVKQRIAVIVIGPAVLVADFQILQIKRRRMTVGRALRTPKRAGVAVGILNQIERILHPRHHLVERNGVVGIAVVAEREAGIDAVKRLHSHVFAELQIFLEAETVG